MTASMQPSEAYCCSVYSSQHEEPLHGTASRAEVWFLLEYNGVWGVKAFKESLIPGMVKAHLSNYLESIPASKLLLIKSRPGLIEPGISFFVIKATEKDQAMYKFQLNGYEDLLDLDLTAILAGDKSLAPYLSDEPLFLVCTNGRRDTCCARNGLPFYLSVLDVAGRAAWQSTHVGGHRFAANSICFPHGIYYGRLEPGDAGLLVEAYQRGELLLEHYRGRACYPPAVQAAEYYLRRQSGIVGLDAFHLLEVKEGVRGNWTIQFKFGNSGSIHRLTIAEVISDQEYYPSCRQDKTSHVTEYQLLEYSQDKH